MITYRNLECWFCTLQRSIVHRCSSGCCWRSVITGPCPALFTHLNNPSFSELIQTEDIFTAVRDALRAVNKLDLDKLISSVSGFCYKMKYKLNARGFSLLQLNPIQSVESRARLNACLKCCFCARSSKTFLLSVMLSLDQLRDSLVLFTMYACSHVEPRSALD